MKIQKQDNSQIAVELFICQSSVSSLFLLILCSWNFTDFWETKHVNNEESRLNFLTSL